MSETKKLPFFSIVIPTKGRPDLLKSAISSVIYQNFSDYELIVSDNFNDHRTREVVKSFDEVSPIRYFRTERELNMPMHWEFATKHAIGKYVMILTDRCVLKQGALCAIHKEIVGRPDVGICSWGWSIFDEVNGIEFYRSIDKRVQEAEILSSTTVVQDFIRKSVTRPFSLPRGLNSCFRADLARQVREKHGALFFPINPDFTSAFLLLAYANNIIHINKALFISQGLSVSNGANAALSNGNAYVDSLKLPDPYKNVPIKMAVVESIIYSDFLMVKEIAGGNLENVEMDWVEYFVSCYREIAKKTTGKLIGENEVKRIFISWETALRSFNTKTQLRVILRLWPFRLFFYFKRSPLGSLLLFFKSKVKSLRIIEGQSVYKTVLDAAGFFNDSNNKL